MWLALSALILLLAMVLGGIGQSGEPTQADGLFARAGQHPATWANDEPAKSPALIMLRQYADKPRPSTPLQAETQAAPQLPPANPTAPRLTEETRLSSGQTSMLKQARQLPHAPHPALPPHPGRAPPLA